MRGPAYDGLTQTQPALRSPAAEFRRLRLADGRRLRRGCDGGVLILESDDIARPDHPASSTASQFVRRMQPWDWLSPMSDGAGVPWIP